MQGPHPETPRPAHAAGAGRSAAVSGAVCAAVGLAALLAFDLARAVSAAWDVVHIDGRFAVAATLLSLPWLAAAALTGAASLAALRALLGARGAFLSRALRAFTLLWALGFLAAALLRLQPVVTEPASPLPAGKGPARSGAPDIVLVVVDTLRGDSLDDPRFGVDLAPNLHRLAGESARFLAASAASSWTRPSTAALFTGRYPAPLGVHKSPLPDSAQTLAESLRAAGYRTAAFSDNYVVSPDWGFAQGFEHFEVANHYLVLRGFAPFRVLPRLVQERLRNQLRLAYMGGGYLSQRASAWLAANDDGARPLFLYLHYMDPHYPYYVYREDAANVSNRAETSHELPYEDLLELMLREPFLKRLEVPRPELQNLVTRYLGGVQYADHQLGAMLERLRARTRWPETLLVVTGDHGEEFLEHGLWGHGHALYEEQVNVPLLVRPPEAFADGVWRGRVFGEPVGTIQVAATVLEIAGLARSVDGEPGFTGLLAGRGGAPPTVYSEVARRGIVGRVARRGPLKALRIEEDGGVRHELYDLAADPGETRDLAAHGSLPPGGGELLREADAFHERLAASRPAETEVAVPDEELERLRALGYVH